VSCCFCVVNSNLLLKVKPDGPVYEVCFTSQLINALSVGSSHLQPGSISLTSAPRTTNAAAVTSVTCNTCPVVCSMPSVNSDCGQMTGNTAAVTSDSSHVQRASSQTCRLTYQDGQSVSDTASCVMRNVSSSGIANTKTLEDLVTAGSSAQSDLIDSW